MPWPAVALLVGVFAVVLLPAALIFGDRTPAAAIGLIVGVFGAILSPRRKIPWPLLIGAACVAGMMLAPSRPALFVLVLGMSAVAGLATQDPAPRQFAIGLAGFLVVGLGIAVFAMHHIHEAFAHWLAMLFVLRGLAAPGQVIRGAVRFGLGAIGGSLAALLVLTIHPPQTVTLILAAVVFLAGLRMLPHPGPYAPAGFSMSILLATAPSIDAAVFRIEAAVFAVLVSTVLATLFSVLWGAIGRFQASAETSSD